MKKIFLGLFVALMVPLQAIGQVNLWEEGEHYQVLDEKLSSKPIVKEYFSFWCPACFRFESMVGELQQQLPEKVKFEKVHVNFMGFTTEPIQDHATLAMKIAERLDNGDFLKSRMFDYIHVQQQGKNISSLEDFRRLFIVNGVEPEEFDKYANGFAGKSLLVRNNNDVKKNRAYLGSVPNFIVNGKYQVLLGAEGLETSQDYIDLILLVKVY